MKIITIYIFLLWFSIPLLSQTNKSIFLIDYQKKPITFGCTIPEFQKLFPNSKLFEEFQERDLQVYLPSERDYDFKLYFYLNRLVAIELSCVSEECYQSTSAFELIGKQIKKQLNLIHEGNTKSATLKFYYSPGYLGFDELYVGSETDDPAFTFKLIDLNYISKFSDQINLNYLFEMSNILYSKGNTSDYSKISRIVEKNALSKIDENPEDFQSYYNPYRVLLEIYEKLKNYTGLLYVWKKMQKYYPNDVNVKKNVKKYLAIVDNNEFSKENNNKEAYLNSELGFINALSQQMLLDNAITSQHIETWGLEKGIRYTEIDLNGDGVSEYWVEGKFGARMPMQYIYRKVGENYEMIGDIGPVDSWDVKKTYHNGYADIEVTSLIGATGREYIQVYRFNGIKYQSVK